MPATISTETDNSAAERLYEQYRPRHYSLNLDIDPDKDDFSGRAEIEMDLVRPTRRITLHSNHIAVSEARVNGRLIDFARVQTQPEQETLNLELDFGLPAGPVRLELTYSAPFGRQMHGLYIAKARHDGKEERHAYTQFESTDARCMFPCVDEPEAKATFDVTVTSPQRFTVLSNTPVLSREVKDGKQTVSFKTSPKMSSYLLALAVGRLSCRSAKVGKTAIGVWSMPHQLDQTGFALDAAKFTLAWLNRYFAISYPLDKLDLVVVPEFTSGAMENWGMITFRDSAMLADPNLSSGSAYRRVAYVVAHEIVHQWFGNLVTMRWWNDLWLNEAFATWLAYKVVDAWKPKWRVWRDYEEHKAVALPIDALNNTRAISCEVKSVAAITAQFDSLTYEKGGAVLRMVESYLGEARFRDGVRIYMRRHQYGNTEARDLWRAIEESSGDPVTHMAEDWLTRPGFPLISVSAISGDARTLKISQSRFSAYGQSEDSSPWIVPIVLKYRLAGERKVRFQRVLLKEKEADVALAGRGKLLWVYPNAGETGFYRVSLETHARPVSSGRTPGAGKELFKSLVENMKAALDPIERSGFLSHAWALTRTRGLALKDLIQVLRGLKGETDWIALDGIRSIMTALHEHVADSEEERLGLKKLASEIVGPAAKKLGWVKLNDDDKRMSRAAALGTFAMLSPDAAFAKKAQTQLSRYLKQPASVDASLATVLLDLGARLGDSKRFSAYELLLSAATTPEQKDHFLKAFAEFQKPELARRALELVLTDRVLGQDIWKPLGYAVRNPAVQAQAWAFVQEHWAEIRGKSGDRGAARVIDALGGFWSLDAKREAEVFFRDPANRIPSADRGLRQALEFMELGASFAERARGELVNCLKE